MSVDRITRTLGFEAGVGVLLAAVLALGGCASTSIADLPIIGTPADAPARPREAGAYLPVHDIPPDREEAALPPAERAKIEAELAAARDRQASAAAAQNSPAK
jgi:hypothetical protein